MINLYYNLGNDCVEAFTLGKASEPPYYVVQPHQVHGDRVAVVIDKETTREQLEGIDALITNQIDCPIAVRTADCVPILLFDPIQNAVAAVHAGWRGTAKRIVEKTISRMSVEYGTKPDDILAVIGPSIGPDSFFVHDDVKQVFSVGGFPIDLICKAHGTDAYLIDLWFANKWLLEQTGVKTNNIQITGICTYFHHDKFYSARYEKNNKCGRNINVIKINNKCEVLRHQKGIWSIRTNTFI